MFKGPGDLEIEEIGLDEIFESVLPGAETPAADSGQTNEAESTTPVHDDPFGGW